MALGTEFRKFTARGNVIDLAVGVVIGAAFSGIVTQLTEAVLMPLTAGFSAISIFRTVPAAGRRA